MRIIASNWWSIIMMIAYKVVGEDDEFEMFMRQGSVGIRCVGEWSLDSYVRVGGFSSFELIYENVYHWSDDDRIWAMVDF